MVRKVALSTFGVWHVGWLIGVLLLLPQVLPAQNFEHHGYTTELTGGIIAHTNGFGITGKFGSEYKEQIPLVAGLDFLYIRHPKEARIKNPFYDGTTPYVFGKLNSLFVIRPFIGSHRKLSIRVLPRDVRLRLNYSIGLDLALLKPVVLGIVRYNPGGTTYRVEYEQYEPAVHTNQTAIFGTSGFFEGLDDLQLKAGTSLKAGLEYKIGRDDRMLQLIETGVILDVFVSEIPIFAFGENQRVFPNLFLQFSIGQRW
ncbi:MAG: hypothetical protein WD077_13030 [Bacteroidia bacterium]